MRPGYYNERVRISSVVCLSRGRGRLDIVEGAVISRVGGIISDRERGEACVHSATRESIVDVEI